ncbi:MAG: hypothetical protein DI635_15130 [Pseudoxanthomonas suwonensis]|nr:MAG: hypothetical protein DI635_15130 [Pseudoxanthomonas suwonensis]
MTSDAPTPRTTTTSSGTKKTRTFALLFTLGGVFYGLGLAAAGFAPSIGIPAWWAALIVLPGIGLMAWANVLMYRSGDEFERAKIAEAILLAFAISTPLILAVGVLQFYVLPELNWIFAFSILMVAWILGTIVSAIRYR